MNLQKQLQKIAKFIFNYFLRRHIKTSQSIVYIKNKATGKIVIEHSRLFISYKLNKKEQQEMAIKIKDELHNFVEVYTHNDYYIFLEKRGFRHTASIECFCDVDYHD